MGTAGAAATAILAAQGTGGTNSVPAPALLPAAAPTITPLYLGKGPGGVGQLNVAELKAALRARGIMPKGLKADLVKQLEDVREHQSSAMERKRLCMMCLGG